MRTRLVTTLLGVALAASAAEAKEPGVTVTLYSPAQAPRASAYQWNYGYYGQYGYQQQTPQETFAVVTERRKVSLKQGDNEIRFEDVASALDPATVHFIDETDPSGTIVVSQSFAYDVSTIDTLLTRFVGQPITAVTDTGERTGTLLWFDTAQLLIETNDAKTPVTIISRGKNLKDIRFGTPPGGLATKPTLIWSVRAKKAGDHLVQVTYQTRNITWQADYTAVLSADNKKMDVSGWLSVSNFSGGGFKDAAVRLISGDAFRYQSTSGGQFDEYGNPIYYQGYGYAPPPPPKVPTRTYSLGRKTDLESNAAKQIEIFAAAASTSATPMFLYEYVPTANQTYRGYGYGAAYPISDQYADGSTAKTASQLDLYMSVKNTKDNGMGMALPGGRLRVYRQSETGGDLELISDGQLDAIDPDGAVMVKVGTASDITVERNQTDYSYDETNREIREQFEVKVTSRRKEAIEVALVEHMFRWPTWTLENESTASSKRDDGETAVYRVKVPASGTGTLTYTVVYSW